MSNTEQSREVRVEVNKESDLTSVTAKISLPAAVWERLTAHLRDDDRTTSDNPALPDTPLAVRIETFLEMLIAEWEALAPESESGLDDAPF